MSRVRAASRALCAALLGLALTGCGVSAADLPLPVPGGDGYRLTAVFADALNLPGGAHVMLNGDEIGRVRAITVRDYTARVEMSVRRDVTLPVGTTAELRQATPLGEVFVALHPPGGAVSGGAVSGGAVSLRDGDTIGLPDTAASATVEDLLTSMSALVNGGGLAQVQTIVAELNAATAGRAPQIAHLLGQSRRTLGTLTARTRDIDRVLVATDRLAGTLHARSASVDTAFDDLSPGIGELAEQTDRLADAVAAAGRVSSTGARLIRRSGDDARAAVRHVGPVLRGFADTRPFLGGSLRDIVTFGTVFESITKGESAAAGGDATLLPLIAPPRPDDRLPGPDDFTDGGRSFTEHLRHQADLLGGPR